MLSIDILLIKKLKGSLMNTMIKSHKNMPHVVYHWKISTEKLFSNQP